LKGKKNEYYSIKKQFKKMREQMAKEAKLIA